MSDQGRRISQAFERDEAFEKLDETTYDVVTTPFDAEVRIEGGENPARTVEVRVPTLSAVVRDEVAPVVEAGWLETLERRMEDAHMPLSGTDDPAASIAIDGEDVTITGTITDPDPRRGANDARAFVTYVEGTYMEGVIPGYEYDEPVASMRERAYQSGSDVSNS